MTEQRIYNFSAGPATLPEALLKEAQAELLNFRGEGMSVMEMSHRSKAFQAVLDEAKSGIIELLDVPDTHDVLFLQGGASLQFSMVPLNLKESGKHAAVVNTGSWSKKAIKEIKKECECRIVASSEESNFDAIPALDAVDFSGAAFAYLCSNNTIFGTQIKNFPETGDVPLVADMSSDILSRRLDISKFGLIFAGAQKNVGPSGITIVIIRKDLVERASDQLPSMLQYRQFTDSNSLYNTIPTFAVYMISLMTKWLKNQGGLVAMEERNTRKSQKLYDYIDASNFYYSPVANTEDRSQMNVVFRVTGDREDLEKTFVQEADAQGLSGLKGHRSVGGLRASIYNAFPEEGIDALIEFMSQFQARYQSEQVAAEAV